MRLSFHVHFADSGKAYESVIYYWEDRNCFKCLYEARIQKKGYAKKLITMMLEDAKAEGVSVIELKATEDGYSLYKSVGFEDAIAKYHNMKIVLQ